MHTIFKILADNKLSESISLSKSENSQSDQLSNGHNAWQYSRE